MEKSISEVAEKFLGNVLIYLAFSLMASSSALFHRGRSSNWHNCGRNEKTEMMGRWSYPW
jgi:hypothetical protein